jgi:subtilisin family serine protease
MNMNMSTQDNRSNSSGKARKSVFMAVVPTLATLGLILINPFMKSFAQHPTPEFVSGEIIVKMKGKLGSTSSSNFLHKATSEKGLSLKGSFPGINIHHFGLKPGVQVQATIEELRKDPNVEYAEPNYILRTVGGGSALAATAERAQKLDYNSAVSALSTSGSTCNSSSNNYCQSGAKVNVAQSWSVMSLSGDKTIVAVIDTGVDYNHSVFSESGAIWRNLGEIPGNGIDDDNNGYIDDVIGWNFVANDGAPMDDDEHGTHVAGTILGATQNILLKPIEQSRIQIMPLKFLAADGSGTTSAAIKAIYYAVNNGAQIINNSWGGPSYSASLHDAMAFAYDHGVITINASGNSGKNSDIEPMYPASYDVPSSMSIAATNDWDSLAPFSNYGVSTVHISSPGVSILSTLPGNVYGYLSGTSMATPFVSGVAALIIREAPHLSGFQVKAALLDSGVVVSGLSGKISSGKRIDALASVQLAKTLAATSAYQPNYAVNYKSEDSVDRAPASNDSNFSGGGGCGSLAVLGRSIHGPGNPPAPPENFMLLSLLVVAPLLLSLILGRKSLNASRPESEADGRRHNRFKMNSEVRVMVGDKELVGSVSTIGAGGVSFNADAMLEKGGIVTMSIQAPDGSETLEVSGRIVWSAENHSYGVEFSQQSQTVASMISKWTKGLMKV